MFWKPRSDKPAEPEQANPYSGLRDLALTSTANLAGWNIAPEGRHVYGGILDWGLDTGTATLFALDDGTASLYLSSGGGVIGGGFHDSVRQAARRFVMAFEPFIDAMEPDASGVPPPAGSTDLRALTPAGRRFVRAPTNVFGRGQHPMSNVFHAGQALIAELRQASAKTQKP